MTHETSQYEYPSTVHVYKMKAWNLLLTVFALFIYLALMSFPIASIIAAIRSAGTETTLLTTILACVFLPLLFLFAFLILQTLLAVYQSFTSYIKVTPEGVENKIWPYRDIRVRWTVLERVNKILFYDVVTMKSFEILGLSLSHTGIMKKLSYLPPSIALSSYNGWPGGQLEIDLRHYAPHLFVPQPASEPIPGPVQNAAGTSASQEHRLLAALSHASVLFTGIGAVVPLVIYYLQKRTSAYLAFQALQAFFYQLLGLFFGFIFPVCLAAGTVVPLMIAIPTGSEETIGPFFIVMFLITMAFTLFIGAGSVVYVIYGIIGAFQAYQGKDFRYPIIGKQVERRSHGDQIKAQLGK